MLKCINERYILLLKKKKFGCILIPRATIKQALTVKIIVTFSLLRLAHRKVEIKFARDPAEKVNDALYLVKNKARRFSLSPSVAIKINNSDSC